MAPGAPARTYQAPLIERVAQFPRSSRGEETSPTINTRWTLGEHSLNALWTLYENPMNTLWTPSEHWWRPPGGRADSCLSCPARSRWDAISLCRPQAGRPRVPLWGRPWREKSRPPQVWWRPRPSPDPPSLPSRATPRSQPGCPCPALGEVEPRGVRGAAGAQSVQQWRPATVRQQSWRPSQGGQLLPPVSLDCRRFPDPTKFLRNGTQPLGWR